MPDGADAGPLRVSHVDYRSERVLELVNEAHTARLEQYSEVRANANRKVQTNDLMAGLVEILYDHDFGEYEHVGPAPSAGVGPWAWAIEIDRPNGVTHVLAGPGLPDKEKKALRQYAAAFLDTYNATYSLQAVEVDVDDSPFQNPALKRN